jgi:hypothetical protein
MCLNKLEILVAMKEADKKIKTGIRVNAAGRPATSIAFCSFGSGSCASYAALIREPQRTLYTKIDFYTKGSL